MIYSKEVEEMCPVTQGVHHGCAPIPEEAKWVKAKNVSDISGYTHGIWFGLSTSQWISIALFIIGLVNLIVLKYKEKK